MSGKRSGPNDQGNNKKSRTVTSHPEVVQTIDAENDFSFFDMLDEILQQPMANSGIDGTLHMEIGKEKWWLIHL